MSTDAILRHRTLLGLGALLWLLAGPVDAGAGEDLPCDLVEVEWRFCGWGREVSGVACYLQPASDWLRIETVRQGIAESDRRRLWSRRGSGWSLAQAGPEGGTLQPWGDAWRQAESWLLLYARVLVAAQEGGASAASAALDTPRRDDSATGPVHRTIGWRASARRGRDDFPTLRLTLPPSVEPDERRSVLNLRGRLAARGRGRGDPGEIWTLRWPADDSLEVRSSRRSGTLTIRRTGRSPVTAPVPEAFLPLWPLAEVLAAIPD